MPPEGDDKTVSLEKITDTPLKVPENGTPLPRNVDPFTGKGGTYDKELGLVGKLVGGNTEKSGNIAFLVIVICLIFIAIVFLRAYDPAKAELADNVSGLITSLISIITGCVGFLFGNNKSKGE